MASVHSPCSFRFLDPFLDFNKLDVGFKQAGGCRMSDVGCRISTSRMSDFYKSDVDCRIFKVGCRMAPISFRTKWPTNGSQGNDDLWYPGFTVAYAGPGRHCKLFDFLLGDPVNLAVEAEDERNVNRDCSRACEIKI